MWHLLPCYPGFSASVPMVEDLDVWSFCHLICNRLYVFIVKFPPVLACEAEYLYQKNPPHMFTVHEKYFSEQVTISTYKTFLIYIFQKQKCCPCNIIDIGINSRVSFYILELNSRPLQKCDPAYCKSRNLNSLLWGKPPTMTSPLSHIFPTWTSTVQP